MPDTLFTHGYAVLIGVGSDLPVTVQDATGLRGILADPQRCTYPPDQVKLLTETNATRHTILDGLDWLAERASKDPQAMVVVYFSGHGGHLPDYHLIPNGYDAQNIAGTAISGAEFTDKLRAIRSQKLLVLLDCCHAGGITKVKAPGFAKSPIPPEIDAVLVEGSGRVVIASSRKDEVSYLGEPYSVFTQALREGLAGYGAAERDGYAYVTDIALYVGRMVPNRTQDKQHPILKLEKADNFAVAHYAGGEKSPQPLVGAQPPVLTLDTELAAKYRTVLRKYHQNLLAVEMQMAQFIDQATVPLDVMRTKKGILDKIDEIETRIRESAKLLEPKRPAAPPMDSNLVHVQHLPDTLGGDWGAQLRTIESIPVESEPKASLTLPYHRKLSASTDLDTRILQVLYAYFDEHPGNPKMDFGELTALVKTTQTDVIRCLYELREKTWLEYYLTDSGDSGQVWLTRDGIKVAKQL